MKIELDENHKYFVNGQQTVGVNELLSHFGFNNYSHISPEIMEQALKFGNVIHSVIKLSESNDSASFIKEHHQIKKHWSEFKKSIELKDCVIDIKTNSSMKPSTTNILQLFGYKILIESCTGKFNTGKPIFEQILFSDIWGFCGRPDYFVTTGKIKKLYILCINLAGFKSYTYDVVKDVKWENEFKALLKVYQIQKREKII